MRLASISPVATWMVHAKGFQDKQDQYWILSVDLGFQPKKDPAKCLVMVLLKGFSARNWNCTFGCEIPLHICAIVTFGLLYFQIMIMIIISFTSAGGTPSLLPKHPAPSLKKSAWWWRWSLGCQKNRVVKYVWYKFVKLPPINWNKEELVVAATLLFELGEPGRICFGWNKLATRWFCQIVQHWGGKGSGAQL